MKPVFIHINKNAGTSIIHTAGSSVTVAGHCTAKSWVEENGQRAPLFAVIRNPFDRVVSEYSYRRKRFLDGEQNPHLSNLHKSFEAWVISTYENDEFRTRQFFESSQVSFNEKNMIGDCLLWFLPQLGWLTDNNDTLLVDQLLRHENLASDWAQFAAQYGLNPILQKHNVSDRQRDHREYYTPKTYEIIRDYYRVDLDRFGYAFD